MLTAGVLKFDPEGRIILSAGPSVYFNGGTPIGADGGLASFLDVLPEIFNAGIGYFNAGEITNSANPLLGEDGALTDRFGQIRVSTGLPAYWYAGLPLTADGRLSISPGIVPPIDEGAFSNAFSNAFDALEP